MLGLCDQRQSCLLFHTEPFHYILSKVYLSCILFGKHVRILDLINWQRQSLPVSLNPHPGPFYPLTPALSQQSQSPSPHPGGVLIVLLEAQPVHEQEVLTSARLSPNSSLTSGYHLLNIHDPLGTMLSICVFLPHGNLKAL